MAGTLHQGTARRGVPSRAGDPRNRRGGAHRGGAESGALDASALTSGFTVAFLIAAAILLLGAVCALRTLPVRERVAVPSR
jgi:hypothetical protein